MIHKIDNAISQGSSMKEAGGSHLSDICHYIDCPTGRPDLIVIDIDYDSLVIVMNKLNKLVSDNFQ